MSPTPLLNGPFREHFSAATTITRSGTFPNEAIRTGVLIVAEQPRLDNSSFKRVQGKVSANFHLSPETAALFARADKAIEEARQLAALVKAQRDHAVGHVDHVVEIATGMRRAVTGHPTKTAVHVSCDGSSHL